jgi:hypothetical protein
MRSCRVKQSSLNRNGTGESNKLEIEMLPDFPALRQILDDAAILRIDAATKEKWPILKMIRGFTAHEGTEHSFLQEGFGTIVQKPEAHQARVEVKFSDVPDLVGEKLAKKLDDIATEMAKQASSQFYRRMNEDTAKVGNQIDAGGQPMSQELALQMFERVDWTPDSVFLASPIMAEGMGKRWQEWKQDRAFMKRFHELMSQKKEQWRDRESCRKLVD